MRKLANRGSIANLRIAVPSRLLTIMIQAALLAAIGSLFLGCKVKSARAPVSLFPETGEVAGWARSGVVRTFDAASLWEYIDGDAERYIQAGVTQILTSDYRYQDKVDAVVEIYLMSAPGGAQKIFSSESATGSQPIQLGDEGRVYQSSLVFRMGSCLARLTADAELPGGSKGLVDLARGIESRLIKTRTREKVAEPALLRLNIQIKSPCNMLLPLSPGNSLYLMLWRTPKRNWNGWMGVGVPIHFKVRRP